jgi:Fic family protein
MQVVSGPFGMRKIHYEAPPPERLAAEMRTYFTWWKESRVMLDGLIWAALAHLYFVTIHPFDDGNGRLARTLSDLALAQDEGTGQRFYSLSAQIMKERQEYYRILERTQKNEGDCTDWLFWFFNCLKRAIDGTEQILAAVGSKAKFWQNNAEASLNERQKKVLTGCEPKMWDSYMLETELIFQNSSLTPRHQLGQTLWLGKSFRPPV